MRRGGIALWVGSCALISCLACGRAGEGGAGTGGAAVADDLLLATERQLAAFDPQVANQLRAAASEATAALGRGGGSAAERAAALGALGQLYQTYDLAAAAESCYDRARELDPDAWEWAYLAAIVLEMGGRSAEAASAFDRALELRPDDVPTLVRAADGRLDRNELDRAVELYERALAVDPRSTPALWGRGRVELRRGNALAAVETVERALEIEPRADRLHATLAAAHRRSGDRDRAAYHAAAQGLVDPTLDDPLLQKISALRTGAGAHMARGYEAGAAGRLEEAASAYARAVESDPNNPEARRGLAGALVALGRRDEALEHFRYALVLEPDSAMAHYNVAATLAEEGARESIDLLDRALELAPEVVEFRLERLARLVALGELDAADAGYGALLIDDPSSLGAAWGRARIATARAVGSGGDPATARAAYDALLRRQLTAAERAELHFERGRLLSAARLDDLGQGDFERAVELVPGYLEARFALANAYGIAGRYTDAAAAYEAVLAAEPDHLGARLGEVTALALDGRSADARASVERGLALTPDHPALLAALRRLDEGGA